MHILLNVDANRCDFACIEKVLDKYEKIFIEFVNFSRDMVNNTTLYDINIIISGTEKWKELAKDLRQIDGLREIKWSHGHEF